MAPAFLRLVTLSLVRAELELFDPCNTIVPPEIPFSFSSDIHRWKICLDGFSSPPIAPNFENVTTENFTAATTTTTPPPTITTTSTPPPKDPFIATLIPPEEVEEEEPDLSFWEEQHVDACEFKYSCRPSMRANGICDPECQTELCMWDGQDCLDPSDNTRPADLCMHRHSCHLSFRGNGRCDAECNNVLCEFDAGDCIKRCVCPNGVEAVGDICPNREDHFCTQCDEGYHMKDNKCEMNVCVCESGIPATAISCYNHSSIGCESCDFGYHLLEKNISNISDILEVNISNISEIVITCVENVCRCYNGVSSTGAACGDDPTAIQCSSCDELYTLHNGACEMDYHVYSSALCFDRSLNYMPTAMNASLLTVQECQAFCDNVPACSAWALIPAYELRPLTHLERKDQIAKFGQLRYDPHRELPHVRGCYRWEGRESYALFVNKTVTEHGKLFTPMCAIKKKIQQVSVSVMITGNLSEESVIDAGKQYGLDAISVLGDKVGNVTMYVSRNDESLQVINLQGGSRRRRLNETTTNTTESTTNTTEIVEKSNKTVWTLRYSVSLSNQHGLFFYQTFHPEPPSGIEFRFKDLLDDKFESLKLEDPTIGFIPTLFLQPGGNCVVSFTPSGGTCISSVNYPASYNKPAQCIGVFTDVRLITANDDFYTDPMDFLRYDKVYSEVRRPILQKTGIGDRLHWNAPPPRKVVDKVLIETEFSWTPVLIIPFLYFSLAFSPFALCVAIPYKMRLDKASKRLEDNKVSMSWENVQTDIPFFSCLDDLHACLYGFCCPAIRAAHTYEKAGFQSFRLTLGWWMIPFGLLRHVRHRLKLLALVRNEKPLTSTKDIAVESCIVCACFPCAVIQEGRLVDEASQLVVNCPMAFQGIDDTDLLREPVKVLDEKSMMRPRVKIKAPKRSKSVSTSARFSDLSHSTIDRSTGKRLHVEGKKRFKHAVNAVLAARDLDRLASENRGSLRAKTTPAPSEDSLSTEDRTARSNSSTKSKRDTVVVEDVGEDADPERKETWLIRAFEKIDINHAGGINYREFMMFLNRKYGVKTNSHAMQSILESVDKDRNGIIDRQEFLDFFVELEELVKIGQKGSGKNRKRSCYRCIIGFLGIANGIVLVWSLVSMIQRCSVVCGADGSGWYHGCPNESRGTCWSECVRPRSINESVRHGMYSQILAMVSGLVFASAFCLTIGGAALFRLCCGTMRKAPETEEIEDTWDLRDGKEDYRSKDFAAAKAMEDQTLTHTFNPFFSGAISVATGTKYTSIMDASHAEDRLEVKVDKQHIEDKIEWQRWSDSYNARNFKKELEECTGTKLERTLTAAKNANVHVENLEEHEERLEKWKKKKTVDDHQRKSAKDEIHKILSKAHKGSETELKDALAFVEKNWAWDNTLLSRSRMYTLCKLRYRELHLGASPKSKK